MSRMKMNWNAAMQSLVLVRLGQELGTASDLAQGIAAAIDAVLKLISTFVC